MDYYDEIKSKLLYNEIYSKVKDYSKNKNDLHTYYFVGKLLCEADKHYGESIVKKYSNKLTVELGKHYSVRLLYKMINYYNFVMSEKMPTLSVQLSWGHYDELLKFDDYDKINCYVVVALKVTELKKEYIGQIEVYMNYIDKNVRTVNQDKTIGIILCKKDNKFIMEYCSDVRIVSRKYELI